MVNRHQASESICESSSELGKDGLCIPACLVGYVLGATCYILEFIPGVGSSEKVDTDELLSDINKAQAYSVVPTVEIMSREVDRPDL